MSIYSLVKSASNLTEMRDIAARICRDYLTGAWKTITADEITLKKVSGGLSNFLFYVSLPDDSGSNSPNRSMSSAAKRLRKNSLHNNIMEPKEVLLRIYGQTHGGDAIEAMVTESVVFTLLSERKLGPKLHGIFPGGRIEQYIPARPLKTAELSESKISVRISQKMAEIHTLDIPVSKEPEWLWNTMEKWMDNTATILSDYEVPPNESNAVRNSEMVKDFDFRKELEWLKDVIDKNDFPVLFSHNDLQEGNILLRRDGNKLSMEKYSPGIDYYDDSAIDSQLSSILLSSPMIKKLNRPSVENSDSDEPYVTSNNNNNLNKSRKRSLLDDDSSDHCNYDNTVDSGLCGDLCCSGDDICDPELMIIDFEYCAYNYRGFDLANHFLEWTFDYTNESFPFYYHKAEQYPTEEQKKQFIVSYLKHFHNDDNYPVDENEISRILDEVRCFTLVSHMFWTLWAFVNLHQEIQFGYWHYGVTRLNEYLKQKEDYMSDYNLKELSASDSRF